MTAEAFNFPWDFLQRVMNRIVNEVHGYVPSSLVATSTLLTLSTACAVSCTTSPRSRPERSRWSSCSPPMHTQERGDTLDAGISCLTWDGVVDMCLDGRCAMPSKNWMEGYARSRQILNRARRVGICNTSTAPPSTRPKPPSLTPQSSPPSPFKHSNCSAYPKSVSSTPTQHPQKHPNKEKEKNTPHQP